MSEFAKNLTKTIETKKQAFENECKAFFQTTLDEVFTTVPGLNRVVIRGWTPGFNDGDPCEHSQNVFLTVSDFADYDEVEDVLNDLDIPFTTKDEKVPCTWNKDGFYMSTEYVLDPADPATAPMNPTLSEGDAEAVHGLFAVLEDAIHRIHGTDFELTITRENDETKVVREHYDCGY